MEKWRHNACNLKHETIEIQKDQNKKAIHNLFQ